MGGEGVSTRHFRVVETDFAVASGERQDGPFRSGQCRVVHPVDVFDRRIIRRTRREVSVPQAPLFRCRARTPDPSRTWGEPAGRRGDRSGHEHSARDGPGRTGRAPFVPAVNHDRGARCRNAAAHRHHAADMPRSPLTAQDKTIVYEIHAPYEAPNEAESTSRMKRCRETTGILPAIFVLEHASGRTVVA